MASINARLALKPLGNCLVNLPSSFIVPLLDSTNLLVQQVIVKLINPRDDKVLAILGWTGFTCTDNSTVEVDANYGKSLGFIDGSNLIISIDFKAIDLPKATSVELEPFTSNDWELTELYAESIEDKFLSQVRCVSINQKLIITPTASSNNQITFIVKSINGTVTQFCPIGNETELHILPKIHNQPKMQPQLPPQSSKRKSLSSRRSTVSVGDRLEKIFRTVIDSKLVGLSIQTKKDKKLNGLNFVHVHLIQGPGTPKKAAMKINEKETEMGLEPNAFGIGLIVKLIQVNANEVEEDDDELTVCKISPLLAISLGVENTQGELICIQSSSRKNVKLDPTNIDISVISFVTDSSFKLPDDGNLSLVNSGDKSHIIEERKKLSEKFTEHLKSQGELVLTNFMKLPIIEGILPCGGRLQIISKSKINVKNFNPWVHIDNTKLPVIKFKGDELVPKSRIQECHEGKADEIIGFDSIFSKLTKNLNYYIPTYLSGKSGSGKSLFASNIQFKFHAMGYFVKLIDFDKELEDEEDIKSKDRNKIIMNVIESTFKSAIWHSPSIVIFENIDKIIPKKMEQGDSGSSDRLTEFIINKVDGLLSSKHVGLLLTGKSKDSINQLIFQKHVTEDDINLIAPTKDQRGAILQHLLKVKFPDFCNDDFSYIGEVVHETEGYYPSDFNNLIDRVYHDLISTGGTEFQLGNFQRAISGYTPTSLRGFKLQKSSNVKWTDIGGLKEVKDVLIETLEWPTKYSPIFENCPIRLRSGILLYGYPGCGKTMLASSIGSKTGLNFISVKGPEILNKYIGASEQSIRELFDRAQSAKPCILFFDEFDSIAPKRGHDSTGVTDRIVNQLLTQMDGAEGLEGVYVIGATSRPDLIDSALLRPGRLDKSLICDLPNLEDRLDILETVIQGNGFKLGDDVDLSIIANGTIGFTGADLQAIAYNSYLKSVHDVLDSEVKNAEEGHSQGGDEKFKFKLLPSIREVGGRGVKQREMAIVKKITNLMSNLNTEEEYEGDVVETADGPNIFISQAHLLESLNETNPSISKKELIKFRKIYGEFQDSKRPGDMKNADDNSTDVGVRSSLM